MYQEKFSSESRLNKDVMAQFEKKSIVVAAHTTRTFGPPQALLDYLKTRYNLVAFIDHPLVYEADRRSQLTVWRQNQIILQKEFSNWSASLPLTILKDIVATWWFFRQIPIEATDCFIGGDNLLTLVGSWLRFVRPIHRLVFYSIDYSPKRYSQPFIEKIYRYVDIKSTHRADAIWCVTERIAQVRRQLGARHSVIVVPNGVAFDQIKTEGKHDKGLVYVGRLTKEKGVDQLIKQLVNLKDQKLTIYGEGPELASLQRVTAEHGLGDRVLFAGHLTNTKILQQLTDYTIGLALYQPDETYVAYADPMKIKEYLAAGLPVITTTLPPIAETVQKAHAGEVIGALSDLGKAVAKIQSKVALYRQHALALAQHYRWEEIYTKAMTETFNSSKENRPHG